MNNALDLSKLKQVPLHQHLQERIYDGALGKMISHPLIQEIMYRPELNELYNKQYEMKTQKCQEAYKAKDWGQYIWWYERPYRLVAFKLIEHLLSDAEYWIFLGRVWIDAEIIWKYIAQWKKLFNSKRPQQHCFMSAGDQDHLIALPQSLTIYRGYVQGVNERGLSYTLSFDRAEWFSKRFIRDGQTPQVVTRHVLKDHVFAYLGGRDEQEIVIRPKYLKGVL